MSHFYKIALFTISISAQFAQAQKANNEEIKVILERHNFWRSEVNIPDLSYSKELATVAYSWASELQKTCAFKHSGNSFGENLFKGTAGYYSVGDAIDSWASEQVDYNYENNKCNKGQVCGHYTQIVWKNTKTVGCAKIICNGNVTWVCNYDPPGNYVGQKPY